MSIDDKNPPEQRTIFQPGSAPSDDAPSRAAEPSPPSPIATSFAPRAEAKIEIGDVLNHIFEVKRFIARGGMGEVFEGINISSEERVAIKVMLPALAADPSVQAMFRKEARTLTRLSHPALVQYRVLAQEPQLGVLYIVTEYIDGANLSDVLRDLQPTPAELCALARRLAAGLRVAHSLGAIHRDISPDNVLLEDGRLDRAKIIDFGIAKDLDPSTKTIVGDGFAGKLNYVAPEQLGDFGRDVGPWSDIYSLGLVLLAVVLRHDVDMGATLVDAVDRRRQGPDLSIVPAQVRPVIEKMLVPNPANRFRSMDEVIAAIDHASVGPAPTVALKDEGVPAKPPRVKVERLAVISEGKSKTGLLVGAALAALALFSAGSYILLGGTRHKDIKFANEAAISTELPTQSARAAIQSVIPHIKCSWLTADRIIQQNSSVSLTISGVAQNPAAAQGDMSRALSSAGLNNTSINFDAVQPILLQACAPLDAFRAIRDTSANRISVQQPKFELSRQRDGSMATAAIINVDIGAENSGFGLYGLEPTGNIQAILPSRASVIQTAQQSPEMFVKTGPNQYRISLTTTHAGLTGLIVLTGREPFDTALIANESSDGNVSRQRQPDWLHKLAEEATNRGWKAQLVWYRTVDEVPG